MAKLVATSGVKMMAEEVVDAEVHAKGQSQCNGEYVSTLAVFLDV